VNLSKSAFVCPRCGGTEWGSGYNFDGPGERAPRHFTDPGVANGRYDGTYTRLCHGGVVLDPAKPFVRSAGCGYAWNSKDDAAHGIPPVPPMVVGTLP
jgi:hypothetical protein